ncbi:MAG: ribulokinase [Bowdeniella nasicola]|nr:ribulokinase [Bowdeniella nasicola]
MSARPPEYSLGIDFGTESARAVLVRLGDGAEIATSVHPYAHGVMDQVLPYTGEHLPLDTALHDADDYLEALTATITSVVTRSGVPPESIVGLGIDSTACTLVFTDADLAPLSRVDRFKSRHLAYVRLWKHHAAQRYADRINQVARSREGLYLPSFGGSVNAEWLLPKALQTMIAAPDVYQAAERIIEAQDWIVSQLVGREVRAASVAGYKASYLQERGGYPPADFLDEVEPGFSSVLTKVGEEFLAPGERAGTLTPAWAERLGLTATTAVAVGNTDAHVSVLGCGVVRPGTMVAVMGTSVCNLLVTEDRHEPHGIQGVVRDGIIPGMWGYEAGQAGVGDTFGWFAKHLAGADIADRALISGRSIFDVIESDAAELTPGECGLLVLDWLSGNRSILVDSKLSGAIVGLTLATRSHHIYRALIEAAGFGQRIILEAFEAAGIEVDRLVVCGGLPHKSPLLMQTMADILNRPIEVSSSTNTPAVGAALHGALAADALDSFEAGARIAPTHASTYVPSPDRHVVYNDVFALYRELHDDFGVTNTAPMYRLRDLRDQAQARRPDSRAFRRKADHAQNH